MILDSSGNVLRRIDPVDVSLDLQLEPLSSAEIELKPGDTIPERSWVSVYTEHGLAGIFRSRPQRDRYGERSSRVSLVHGACELNDYLTMKGGDQEQDPANTAIAYIMQFYLGTHWRLGTVSATSSVVYQLNGSGVLDAITEIMEQLPGYMLVFDQSVTPWTLNVLPRPETVSAEGRLSRNISSVEISRDDSSLCTRVYYGENDLFVEDAAAIQKYGVIEYRISDSGLTNTQLAAIAQAYLDNHKTSKLSVSISAIDFYNATGEPLDRIALGSKYRLAIPDAETEENRVIEAIICSIRYDSVYSNNPQITLASDPDTIITFLKKQRRSGGSARQIAKEEADKQYQHWTTENEVYKESVYKILGVELNPDGTVKYVQAKDAQGNPIYDEQGNPVWETDSAGNPVPVYNEESEGSLGGSVKQTAQDLTSLYTETGVASLPAGVTNLFSYASTIKQTAESIQTEVTAARGTSSSLGDRMTTMASNINQQADKISLVVTSTTHEGQTTYSINTAGIIVAINGGGQGVSSTIISSDKIDLQGYVTADQIFATDTTIGQYLTANNAIFQTKVKTAELEATNGAIIESGLEVSDGAVVGGGLIADSISIGTKSSSTPLGDAIKQVTLSGPDSSNMYTLTATTLGGQTINIGNFSRAASPGNLTGSWSGAVYTVTNGSQNWTIDFDPTATSDATWATEIGTGTVNQNNSKWLDFPLYIGSYNQGGQMTHNVTISKSINATAVYTAGQDSVVSTFDTPAFVPSSVTPTDLLKGTVRRYHVTKDGTDVVDSYFRVPNYSATLTPASTSGTKQTLSEGVYGLYVTKDGAAEQTPIAYYEVSGGTGADPKVSKSEWQNGSTTFTAGTSGQSSIPVSLSIVPTTNWSAATVPVNPTFRIDDGQSSTGLTGTFRLQVDNDYVYVKSNTDNPVIGTNVLAMQTNGAYSAGQQSVSATLRGATTQTTYTTLEPGYYGLYRTIDSTAESTAVGYYRVTSGGTSGVKYVVSSSGDPITVWDGLSIVGNLYPNTDVITGGTDQLNRTQVTYRGRTGYVGSSYISTTKGATNYIGRIGWTDEGSDASTRSVTALSNVILSASDTGTSSHNVNVTYDDGTTVQNGATITIDASAIAGGGGGANLGHRRFTTNNTYYATDYGLDGFSSVEIAVSGGSGGSGGVSGVSKYAESDESTDFADWTFNATKSQSKKYAFYKIAANDGSTYNFGVDASDVYIAGQQSGGGSNRTVSSLSSITLSRSDTGTSTKNTTVTYTSGSNSTASISINASNVYQQGVDDGYAITTTEISAGSFSVQTGSTSGRTSAGSISGQSVYNARNRGYLFFSVTCRGKTRNFYVSINA